MPRTIIAGNWKMHTTLEAAEVLVRDLAGLVQTSDRIERVLCPPLPWIVPLVDRAAAAGFLLGAQDCAVEDEGAFTGEVSAKMLAPYCHYIIVGHSERRHILHESDEQVAGKLRAVLRNRLRPILCVGETLEQREGGHAQETVTRQLRGALDGISPADLDTDALVVAYEPVWAIGTGRAATPNDASQMAAHIRSVLTSVVGEHAALRVPIQYGGSVNPANAASFMQLVEIDGLLVGGASLRPDQFAQILASSAVN